MQSFTVLNYRKNSGTFSEVDEQKAALITGGSHFSILIHNLQLLQIYN